MRNKLIYLSLFVLFILAFLLRVWFLRDNVLSFYYDQARDAINISQILSGDVKIQGPPSSEPGLYHGVFYYYFLAPAYLIGNGSPIFAAYYLAFFNSLTIILVFLIAKIATKNTKLALLSAIFFAVSFESSQYATWISNPTIAVFFVPLMYLGLWMWTQNKSKYGPIIAALGLGLSIQSEIFLIYHIIPFFIWLSIYKKNVSKKSLINFFVMLFISIFTLILCELKFGFGGIKSFVSLGTVNSGNIMSAKSLGDYLVLYLNQIGRVFALNTYPGNVGYGGGLIITLAIYSLIKFKKDKYPAFLVIWLFSHIWVVSVGGISTPFLMVGIGPAVSLILAYYVIRLFNKKFVFGFLTVLVVLYGNLSFIFSQNDFGSTLFAIQKEMLLKNQIAAIDYTYKIADGRPFSINSLTSPLWINLVWTYLYKWYGLPKYGYIPSFHGHDQVGQIDGLEQISKPEDISFLILEPMAGIPPQYLPLTIGEEDVDSLVVEEKSFNGIIVQSRKLLDGK